MYIQSEGEYYQEMPQNVVKDDNHFSRNAICPGILSTQILKRNIEKMSIEQIKKHLDIIEQSFKAELEIIENRNNQVEQGNILIFRKKDRA